MKNKSVWATRLRIILLTGVLASAAAAQESQPPSKPAQGGGPPPSASADTAATPGAAASSEKVVLKVGATQVTQAEIEWLISTLGRFHVPPPQTGRSLTLFK